MNIILKIVAIFLLVVLISKASENKPSEFIPKGYVELERIFGDLNADTEDDCVLIIKKIDKNNIVENRFGEKVDRNRRGVVILFKKDDGYELADKNYDCFLSENEDGGVYYPPELWIDIKDEKLHVHYAHGRYGYWEYIFRFQNSNFELIGYESSNNHGPIVKRQTSINFLTKKRLTRENINKNQENLDEIFTQTWSSFKMKNLIKLSEIEEFDRLDTHFIDMGNIRSDINPALKKIGDITNYTNVLLATPFAASELFDAQTWEIVDAILGAQ